MKSKDVFKTLQQRGYIFQTSNETGLRNALRKKVTLYQGFDPSSESLHLGHFLSIMMLHHLQEAGHAVIFLLGGGTGRVGDPTGKSTSRSQLTKKTVEQNAQAIKKQVEAMGLLKFHGTNAAIMVNNDEWLSKFSFLEDFLMKIARHFSVNEMVGMRTFDERFKAGKPLSLLEFCYPVLQAWDFLELHKRHKCILQIGGQDQWANILQGVELIRKELNGTEVFALTHPLLTTPDGVKMGKTEKGPVWLDSKKTTPFEFYQYLIKTPDSMVPNMLRLFTFLPLEEIDLIIKNPKQAQERLAYEVTKIVHGEEAAIQASGGESIPVLKIKPQGILLEDALVTSKCLPSKSEVWRRVAGSAVSINDEKVTDSKLRIKTPCLIKYGKGKLLRIELTN